jgi:hypothetical protein
MTERFKATICTHPLAGDCGFEFLRGRKCNLWVLCCQVAVSATGRSLVQRSPTDCGMSLCVIEKLEEIGGCGPRRVVAQETTKVSKILVIRKLPSLQELIYIYIYIYIYITIYSRGIQSPSGGKKFFIFHTCSWRPWGLPGFLNDEYGGTFPGKSGLVVAFTIHPVIAPMLREWRYTSARPVCLLWRAVRWSLPLTSYILN